MTMSDTPTPTYYTCKEDPGWLRHTDISEAIEDWLDDMHPDWPESETVTVYGHALREVSVSERDRQHHATIAAESIIIPLDEDYRHDDGDEGASVDSPAIRAAALALLDAILAEYSPSTCDHVTTEEVKWREHVGPAPDA